MLQKTLLWCASSLDLVLDVDHARLGTARTKQAKQTSGRSVSGARIPQQVLTETGSTLSPPTIVGQGLSRSGMMSWEGGVQVPSPSQEAAVLPERWTYSCTGTAKMSMVTKQDAGAVRRGQRLSGIFIGRAPYQHE